jgi:membrane-bound serine protease (ClpP class)
MTALAVVLLVAGASLLVVEAHVASYGVLGLAGAACVAAGAALAVASTGASAAVALAVATPVALALAALFAVVARKTLAVRRRAALGGSEGLIGRVGVVRHELAPEGDVVVRGELWRARRSLLGDEEDDLLEGTPVVIDRVHGLTVSVRRAEEWELLP